MLAVVILWAHFEVILPLDSCCIKEYQTVFNPRDIPPMKRLHLESCVLARGLCMMTQLSPYMSLRDE
jgi:hypothetical protein